jgi:hypothetical protein
MVVPSGRLGLIFAGFHHLAGAHFLVHDDAVDRGRPIDRHHRIAAGAQLL